MSMIPVQDSCRHITIEKIRENIFLDKFNYKSVRVLGRILQLQDPKTGYCLIESLEKGKPISSVMDAEKKKKIESSNQNGSGAADNQDMNDDDVDLALNEELQNKQKDDWHILHVDTYSLKMRELESGQIYEFLGEIEQNQTGFIYLKARVIKTNTNKNGRLASSGINSTYEIYKYQTDKINDLIESLFNRNKPQEPQAEQRSGPNLSAKQKSDTDYNFTHNNGKRLNSSNQNNNGLPDRQSSDLNDEYASYGVGESAAQLNKQPLFEEKNKKPISALQEEIPERVPAKIQKEQDPAEVKYSELKSKPKTDIEDANKMDQEMDNIE